MATQQDNAIQAARDVISFAAQFRDLRNAQKAFQDRNTSANYITILNALPTFAWNTDGSAGAADGSPNNTHPISTDGLNVAANDVLGLLYMVADFISFMENGTVSQSNRVGVIEKVLA